MNLFEELKKVLNITLNDFSESAWVSHNECEQIIRKNDLVENLIYKCQVKNLNSLTDYSNYLILEKISKLKTQDNSIVISKVSELANDKIKNIEKRDVIKFLNVFYSETLKNKDLYNNTIKKIIEFQKGISKEVFIWLAVNEPLIFISKFDKLEKVFTHQDIIEKVLVKKNIEILLCYNYKKLFRVLKKKTLKDYECVKRFNDLIFNYYRRVCKSLNVDNIFKYFDVLKSIKQYFISIQFPNAIECDKSFFDVENLLDKAIKQKGSSFCHKIDSNVLDEIFDSNLKWKYKLLSITHKVDNENLFSFKCSDEFDCFASDVGHNKYFTSSRQDYIKIVLAVGRVRMHHIFAQQNYRCEFKEWVKSVLDFLCKKFKYDNDDIIKEFEIIYELVLAWFLSDWTENLHLNCAVSYNIQMLLCVYIEKLLRLVYKSETKATSLNYDLTLAKALSDNLIQAKLGEDLANACIFILCKDKDNIGCNYRNKLAHLYEIDLTNIDSFKNFELLFLYVSVVNSIFIKSI